METLLAALSVGQSTNSSCNFCKQVFTWGSSRTLLIFFSWNLILILTIFSETSLIISWYQGKKCCLFRPESEIIFSMQILSEDLICTKALSKSMVQGSLYLGPFLIRRLRSSFWIKDRSPVIMCWWCGSRYFCSYDLQLHGIVLISLNTSSSFKDETNCE